MAPAPAALAGLNGAGASASPFAMAALARRAHFEARTPQSKRPRTSFAMNDRGDFNGTCNAEEASPISPETPAGSCASYFADVSDYCCAAVGGIFDPDYRLENTTGMMAAAFDHPICRTSNYADMFSCYQYVTETHCSGTTPVPYGVCSRNGNDTSNILSTSGSAHLRPANGLRWVAAGVVLLATAPLSLLL